MRPRYRCCRCRRRLREGTLDLIRPGQQLLVCARCRERLRLEVLEREAAIEENHQHLLRAPFTVEP